MSNDDLVTRLEAFSDTHDMVCYGKNCGACQEMRDVKAAAARITELEAENAQWRDTYEDCEVRNMSLAAANADPRAINMACDHDRIAALEAENERLREAGAHLADALRANKSGNRSFGDRWADNALTHWAAALSGEPT